MLDDSKFQPCPDSKGVFLSLVRNSRKFSPLMSGSKIIVARIVAEYIAANLQNEF